MKGVSLIRAISEHFSWKLLSKNAAKLRKFDLFMDAPFVDTPFGPAQSLLSIPLSLLPLEAGRSLQLLPDIPLDLLTSQEGAFRFLVALLV